MFSASLELSVLAVGSLLSGAHSPVREELSTIAELHQMKRRSAGILSPGLPREGGSAGRREGGQGGRGAGGQAGRAKASVWSALVVVVSLMAVSVVLLFCCL